MIVQAGTPTGDDAKFINTYVFDTTRRQYAVRLPDRWLYLEDWQVGNLAADMGRVVTDAHAAQAGLAARVEEQAVLIREKDAEIKRLEKIVTEHLWPAGDPGSR